jgi:hypothetical protein
MCRMKCYVFGKYTELYCTYAEYAWNGFIIYLEDTEFATFLLSISTMRSDITQNETVNLLRIHGVKFNAY